MSFCYLGFGFGKSRTVEQTFDTQNTFFTVSELLGAFDVLTSVLIELFGFAGNCKDANRKCVPLFGRSLDMYCIPFQMCTNL